MSDRHRREVDKLVAGGLALVVTVETIVLVLSEHRHVLWVSGVAVALVFVIAWRVMLDAAKPPPVEVMISAPDESLRSWIARTEILLRWADGSRSDWDRHLRPRLAREFMMATGHRQGKDANGMQATGRMMFGDMWQWVDPSNVSPNGRAERGPGRNVLDQILQRLERP